ncbi:MULTISPECIES: DUF3604 domain-containing protein [unclassified Ruegeria]|uniref:DUF3604 domain-containing protein n=1 Tax=unclassified Ruegeria TaxID=2625375 RepID=UPI001ADCB7BC|nr:MULTISPECIES: DUF3604 domain-containing protein [unclassified Ruegeria]MBO9410968.1 DUF3604 domain-containing protein [Ruegeria sp. R8_1]MBO9415169.1 DUF3604 domain-containing protein [Ruegeria sp. R8_2]
MKYFVLTTAVVSLYLSGPLVAQEAPPEASSSVLKGTPYSPYADRAYPERVLFGDTHVHTALSADAGGGGTRLMPRDAYRFARGEQVISNTGQPVKLSRPFDFYMITDHSDGMGAITDILSGAPNIMADEQGRKYHEAFNAGGEVALRASAELTASFAQGTLSSALNYQPGNPAYERVWDDLVNIAEEFNQPGVFTTFAAFEWTSLVSGNNLHRNVILRDGPDRTRQLVPYTTTPPMGSPNPRDLYAWLQTYEDTTGGDALAIAHNGNLSNGWMFSLVDDFAEGTPALDAEYARARQKWEPLYEWTQFKGDGEAHPFLSPDDEFADYETWDWANLDVSERKTPDMLPGEYARSGLLRGLAMQAELGVNPYKFGASAATDTHTGLSTVADDNFFGKFAAYEPNAERANHVARTFADGEAAYYSSAYSSAGMTAVWARENTRGEIFDAMQRREAYATTGPRMTVRFFGGDYSDDVLARRDLARIGYSGGVPMGGDLAAPANGQAPDFLVYSLRDPMGANLDRIQIIKGWIDAETGEAMEQVYDVAWGGDRSPDENGQLPPVGNTVDLSIPSWTNTIGSPELGAVWTDPDFDPEESAFYYARVIEIPTPRWTAYDAVKFGAEMPEGTKMVTQERAYTSPIWYTP